MSGQTAYEINGVTVAMTDVQKARWDANELTPSDFTGIRVSVGEQRWPGGMPSLKTVRNYSAFADVARKLDGVADEPTVRPWHEWRDVKKELPTESGIVMAYLETEFSGTGIFMLYYSVTTKEWVFNGINSQITHWMPMPPKPDIPSAES